MPNCLTAQTGSFYCAYDPELTAKPSADYFSHQYWEKQNRIIGKEHGRGTTLFVRHESSEWVLRHYLRGGFISKFNKESYFFSSWKKCRSIAEFHILQELVGQGLAVPKPVAACVERRGIMYQADILIEKIPGARDFIQILKKPQSADFYRELATFIARFHQKGIYHADMNIQNILQDEQQKFWLIDFDRAKLLSPETKWQNETISRLHRSFIKEKERNGIIWEESDWAVFEKAYRDAMLKTL